MPEPDIRKLIHEVKSPLTLLGVFFSSLNERESPEEVFSFIKQFSIPCKNAVKEIEKALEAISESKGAAQ